MTSPSFGRPGVIAAGDGCRSVPGDDSAGDAVLVARAGNFARLRRDLGRSGAERLAPAIAARIVQLLAPDRLTIVALDTVEIGLTGIAPADLSTAAAAVVEAFVEPLSIDGEQVAVDLILGGAAAAEGGVEELRLIEEAEAALADAVRSGAPAIRSIGRHAGFDRAALSRDLVTAMRDGELLLHYQPKVHLRSREIGSVEALIRWQHPTRGLVYPGDFIPLAEASGDIAALTLWSLGRVIADQRAMAARGHDLTVYVNIAGLLLGDDDFVARACTLVGEAGVPIGFEITETSVIRDPDSAIAHLNSFAAIGIPISIDDYGAGLSSLAYLKRLPARELKIDKLFVTQLTSSHRDPLIVRSTIDLAHALEMQVVAEGVETQAALALLSVMGCDMAQGFLISQPLRFDRLLAFCDEHRDGWNDGGKPASFPAFAGRLVRKAS